MTDTFNIALDPFPCPGIRLLCDFDEWLFILANTYTAKTLGQSSLITTQKLDGTNVKAASWQSKIPEASLCVSILIRHT